MRWRWRRAVRLMVGALCCTLAPACYGKRIDALEKAVSSMLAALRGAPRGPDAASAPRLVSAEDRLKRLEQDVENLASGALCTDARIRQFLNDCRATNGCRADNFEANLSYMIKQPHVMAYLDAKTGVESLTDFRRGQLLRMIEQQVLLSSTTLLVVTMPAGGFEQQDVAFKHALKLRGLVLGLSSRLNDVKKLQPQAIGCNKTTQRYPAQFAKLNTADRAEPPEPKAQQPQVIAWVFLVNC